MRDLIVGRGFIRDTTSCLDFSIDKNFRQFSIIHYMRKLLNGEKHDRIWLDYSKKLDKAF